jgi:phospholipid/cholesterol/gamma-HCH transport system substrate-binding protein
MRRNTNRFPRTGSPSIRDQGMGLIRAGLLGCLLVGIAVYLVFGGQIPFTAPPEFTLHAVFTSETQLHIPSPVRIAGVDVGTIDSIKRMPGGGQAADVTMQILPSGLPIHTDATITLRPRIFLEGNYYADLHPGSPSSPVLRPGATLAAANTSGPVQLDRVLSALGSDSRTNLQTLLRGLGSSLYGAPRTTDPTQDPITRSLSGGQALNQSLRFSVDAFRASALVNQALLGTDPHDLTKVVQGNQQVFRSLADAGPQLPDFITTFDATMATLASRQVELQQTISALPPLFARTQSSDTALDRSFAPTITFANTILPGLRQLDPTIGQALPWLAQATALASPSELRGLLTDLTPAVQNTAASLSATRSLLSASGALARCFTHNIVPAGNQRISDPPITTGLQVYQEFFQASVGLAGAAGNFDGNGRFLRAVAGGGPNRQATPVIPGNGPEYGNFVAPSLGTRPAFAGNPPPLRRDVACDRNPVPNLNSAPTGIAP